MKKSTVAILGSSSHIAKGLINNFLRSRKFSLHLFTTSPGKVAGFLGSIGKFPDHNCVIHSGYQDFMQFSYEVIINCVGVGTASKLQGNYANYFTVAEEYDNLAIAYLQHHHPDTLYISFSSGAVYGSEWAAPAAENTVNCIPVNRVAPENYYTITRLYAEAKHRALKNLPIVDLRIFSYFSRFIDLADSYFINEIIDCVQNKKLFVTNEVNIVRDYVHPEDLFAIINQCVEAGKINTVFDVTSAKPVEKQEMLDYFSLEYGLKYEVSRSLNPAWATGSKNIYYSVYTNAAAIGYKPVFSSMETIQLESESLLSCLTGVL